MVRFPKISKNKGAKSKNRGSAAKSATLGRKLSIETLESRELLAADMAEISGIVRTDLQGDNTANNDTVVVGATATLYRDGGNGTFDAGWSELRSRPTLAVDTVLIRSRLETILWKFRSRAICNSAPARA